MPPLIEQAEESFTGSIRLAISETLFWKLLKRVAAVRREDGEDKEAGEDTEAGAYTEADKHPSPEQLVAFRKDADQALHHIQRNACLVRAPAPRGDGIGVFMASQAVMGSTGLRTSPRRGPTGGHASGVVARLNFTPDEPVLRGGSIWWEGRYEPIIQASWVSATGMYSVKWASGGFTPTNVGYFEFNHKGDQAMVTPARSGRSSGSRSRNGSGSGSRSGPARSRRSSGSGSRNGSGSGSGSGGTSGSWRSSSCT